jgi:hypothetical protein
VLIRLYFTSLAAVEAVVEAASYLAVEVGSRLHLHLYLFVLYMALAAAG